MHFVRARVTRGNFLQRHRRRSYIRNGKRERASVRARARERSQVSAPAYSKLQFRGIDQRPPATCKDSTLHSSTFDNAHIPPLFFFFFSLSPWHSMGIYRRILAFYYGRQSVDRFDFAAVVNGHYELTFGTIRYTEEQLMLSLTTREFRTESTANVNINDLHSFECYRVAYRVKVSRARAI